MGYEAQAQAALAPPEQPAAEQEDPEEPEDDTPQPTPAAKTDAFDRYEAQGLRIHVTHRSGDIRAGYLVGPDGQRTDASSSAPLMIFGPNRTRAYKLYRARFACDGALVDGPYATGFASMRAARSAVATFFPRQTVAGLSPVPEGELEALRAGWEAY